MKIIGRLVLGLGLFALPFTLQAQSTMQEDSATEQTKPITLNTSDMATVKTLSEAELAAFVKALDVTPQIAYEDLPETSGTFYSLQNPDWPPLPGDVNGSSVWPMNGFYLLNDVYYDYSAAPQARSSMMMTMDSLDPGDPGDGGTNIYTPNELEYTPPDYGTNLWIAQVALANGYMTAIASNTVALVPYEIQTNTDLTTTNWVSTGLFIYGAEDTNWTAIDPWWINPTSTNLFFRLRSWADDGTGLPIWWEQQYGVSDPYDDPDGDGWSNLQEFQNGTNPNQFNTPPMPQGLKVVWSGGTGGAVLTWQSAPGPVTNYLITKYDYQTGLSTNISVLPADTTFADDLSDDPLEIPDDYLSAYGPAVFVNYAVTAQYAGGESTEGNVLLGFQSPPVVGAARDSHGNINLIVTGLPANCTGIKVYRAQDGYSGYLGREIGAWHYTSDDRHTSVEDPLADGDFEVSSSGTTNGIYPVPTNQFTPFGSYHFWVQGELADGKTTEWSVDFATDWIAETGPLVDLRQHLKDNLHFLLRAADMLSPFQYGGDENNFSVTASNYVCASIFEKGNLGNNPSYGEAWPLTENYQLRNFVYDPDYIGTNGQLMDGIYYDYDLNISNSPAVYFDPAWLLVSPLNVPDSVLNTNQTRWITPISGYISGNPITSGACNYYGLPYLSVNSVGYISNQLYSIVYSPITDEWTTNGLFPYFETAQPVFQAAGYYFARPSMDLMPEQEDFSTTNITGLLIQGVGSSQQIAGYAKLEVTNSAYTGVYGYLGQYFDQAYKVDDNGNVTTNTTGILSPYGNFFATEPGDVALVTMPDLDTGERGTGIVHCVSLQVDKNHDGVMDLSFNGADATSQASPMVFWVNSGWCDQNGVDHPNYGNTNYMDGQIEWQRDLENFTRLWFCGIPALPAAQGYTVTLSWNVVSGNPAINLFKSVEVNGGIGYLTDTNIAAAQTVLEYPNGAGLIFAHVPDTGSFTFPNNFFDGTNKCFLFEGAGTGEGQLTLTISQNGNIIAQTGVWLDLHNVKDLYEQAHITGVPITFPEMIYSTNATAFVSDHQLADNATEDKQLVVFVHGWRMGVFDYQSFSDSMFRRLYWAGYHGRFAALRWPTLSKDDYRALGEFVSYTTYNRSEYIAHRSADGASTYFDWLKTRLPDYSINAVAHSMGNIVMMDALKLQLATGTNDIDNYVMMQAAVPAHCYDTSLADYGLFTSAENATTTSHTPDVYRGFPGNLAAAVNGQIVNFFNTNDFALATGTWGPFNVSWEANQVQYKPDAQWSYSSDGTNCFEFTGLGYRTLSDPREQMAFVARPRSRAVGAQPDVGGVVQQTEQLNLSAAYNFREKSDQHSAEFNWNIQRLNGTNGFYQVLLQKLFP